MKILVADDSPSFRAALTRMLVEAGYEVVRARDGVEALSVFYVEQPDVVLLDLLMPRLTGWVVCRI
ncbi:MAG: response regulator, partial [Actinobacteria bacterium]|nr:response regulator [Actinomycetota bacterium]